MIKKILLVFMASALISAWAGECEDKISEYLGNELVYKDGAIYKNQELQTCTLQKTYSPLYDCGDKELFVKKEAGVVTCVQWHNKNDLMWTNGCQTGSEEGLYINRPYKNKPELCYPTFGKPQPIEQPKQGICSNALNDLTQGVLTLSDGIPLPTTASDSLKISVSGQQTTWEIGSYKISSIVRPSIPRPGVSEQRIEVTDASGKRRFLTTLTTADKCTVNSRGEVMADGGEIVNFHRGLCQRIAKNPKPDSSCTELFKSIKNHISEWSNEFNDKWFWPYGMDEKKFSDEEVSDEWKMRCAQLISQDGRFIDGDLLLSDGSFDAIPTQTPPSEKSSRMLEISAGAKKK